MKTKFAIVILHYLTIDDTKDCVSSIIEKSSKKNIDIIIVDNGSYNNSGYILKKLYKDNKNIHILLSKKNIGFANGNNIGIKYAVNKLDVDFVIVLNNDTCIIDDNFFDKIEKEYKKTQFAVLGPKIILPNNKVDYYSKKYDIININYYKRSLLYIKLKYIFYKLYLGKLFNIIMSKRANIINRNNQKKVIDKREENVILHGCCLIFSRTYLDLFDNIDDRTFMYYEEDLLAIRLIKNKLKSIYNPDIFILHKDDGATNELTKTKRKKILFITKHQIKSLKIIIKELKTNID